MLSDIQKKEVFRELLEFDGLPPYEDSYARADGYFANHLKKKYGMPIPQLRKECGITEYANKCKEARQNLIKEMAEKDAV